jgi:hypothetical protein
MSRKLLSGALVLLLSAIPLHAANSKHSQQANKIRAGVLSLGTGSDARVQVTLRNKVKVAGYISESGAESFTIVNPETGLSTNAAYTDVKKVSGHNLSTGAKIAIIAAIAGGVMLALAIYIMNPD